MLVDALWSAVREGNYGAGNKRRIHPSASKNSYGSAMQRLIGKIIKKPSTVLLKTITQQRAIKIKT
jgi:hypothetical protein